MRSIQAIQRVLWASCTALVIFTGCASISDSEPPTAQSTGPASAGIEALGTDWVEINPGGATTCSDGTPYRFFVRKGETDKLVVYLQGGGACWFRGNCDPQMNPTYTQNIPPGFKPLDFGIFNADHAQNPVADYSIVFAPYCTGDVHLGARDTVYPAQTPDQQPLTIHHRGRANMAAVLDWTVANVPAPSEIFVTGSSAGAIPSPFYAALIAELYPNARVAQLGDGAGGYRRLNDNDTRPDQAWGTFDFINNEPGFSQLDRDSFNYEKLYIAAAKAHPKITFTQYDAAEDAVQKRFLALSGTKDISLFDALNANHADILAEVSNFKSISVGGGSHTILGRPEFYTYAADNISVRDWVANVVDHNPLTDATCTNCETVHYAGPELPVALAQLWNTWESPTQYVEPFQIFDNVYYVGIDWVAAYLIDTSDGLILVDSLYGKWVQPLIRNIMKLGFNPADVKYVINTHGHFDHAGGSRFFQNAYGATVVMAEEDWHIAEQPLELPMFYMPVPARDIVATDGQVITLGDTQIGLFKTPGHTEGVLTLRYKVFDGDEAYTAVTLGGVGLNFSGVARTEQYLDSYARLQSMQDDVSVSLPNHAAMGNVFQRAAALAKRDPNEPHPFVDPAAYKAALASFVSNATDKLAAEQAGTATDPLDELTNALE